MTKLNEELLYGIYSIVEEIPVGKVATYGQIAELAGISNNSRLVGKAMGMVSMYGHYPCYRVVNSQGRLVPGWDEQLILLQNEGVIFKENGYVDLKLSKWSYDD